MGLKASVWLGAASAAMLCVPPVVAAPAHHGKSEKTTHRGAASAKGKGKAAAGRGAARGKAAAGRGARVSARPAAISAVSVRLNSAFVASESLRPMAQQLASTRSAAGFSAVSSYAASHAGAGAETAYLAIGHAYALERAYGDAANAFRQAAAIGDPLGDYAEYLGAQALINEQHYGEAVPLLTNFAQRHPDSVFNAGAPVLLADTYLQAKDGPSAVRILEPLLGTPEAEHADFKLALARGYQASGQLAKGIALYKQIFDNQPLTFEATQARAALMAIGAGPSAAERKVHADQLYNAKRYSEAEAEYESIKNDPTLAQADRDGLAIYAANCDLKLKHLSRHDVDKLPVTNDDTAALKMYLYAEISRNEKDRVGHDAEIAQMVSRYPHSRWTEEALYSGGNMYLLTHDMPQAIYHYKLLVERFPTSLYAPSAHWREAWMNYRLRNYSEAARLMDEQVLRYGAGTEVPAALYWRGRMYEDEEHDFAHAAAYYRSVDANYPNYYYGLLARQRLAVLGQQPQVAETAALGSVRHLDVPDLTDAVPANDPHVIKAKLLANAALNEYIAPEIAAAPGSGEWGALAQAQIYASFGEVTRTLQSMKKSGIPFFALPVKEVPTSYWRLIFPQPYWSDLVTDSERNGLDPYLVASLIRQESEFNAGAVSGAHAYGLMQLIPSTGKENAKKEGIKHFDTGELLNPSINLELGTRNLRSVLDRFGGQPEYALAAYNAGETPVRQWMASGDYKDLPEFVESIPILGDAGVCAGDSA